MPMLIPNPKSISKSIESISKSGVDIDEVVRNSFNRAVKNNMSKFSSKEPTKCLTTNSSMNRESKPLDKNTIICNATIMKTKNVQVFVNSTTATQNNDETKKLDENNNIVIKKENTDVKTRSTTSLNGLDDSLTNLQWLTDVKVNDILEGKPITYEPLSPAPSNSSDDGDERKYSRRHYSDTSVDYRTNKYIKPPYSYAALIIMAMKSKSCAKMTLSEIYKWITDNFSFYKSADASWQNSIRHNLSLNKCFAKIPRNKGDPGKGGYWRIVPEFANKLLESNIRKRRSTMIDYNCQDIIKRQRLDLFENQLLCKIKPEIKTEPLETTYNNNNHSTNSSSRSSPTMSHDRNTPIQADREQCRMDHPYGKNPYVIFNTNEEDDEEENIKALANDLQQTSSNVTTTSLSNDVLSNSTILNTFSSAIVSDCIWSSQYPHNDNLTESMTKVTEELLEARNYSHTDSPLLSKTLASSLNSSGSLLPSPFCLSPPLSDNESGLSDDLDEFDETPVFNDDVDLTVRGTGLTLFEPTAEMIASFDMIKDEPLSPLSLNIEE